MRVINITTDNLPKYKSTLIELSDAFLASLGENNTRTLEEKENILKLMVSPENYTHYVLALDKHETPVGISYFNEGTGYSCGGGYIWINGIYVSPEAQKQGIASAILQHIENQAKAKKYTLIICSRHSENRASEKLFKKAGFEQNTGITMEKVLTL